MRAVNEVGEGPPATATATPDAVVIPIQPPSAPRNLLAVNAAGAGPTADVRFRLNAVPAFPQADYAFELPENRDGSRLGIALGKVTAEDADDDVLEYALASGDAARFAVFASDGAVTYIGPGEDFEAEPNEYVLTVQARDPAGAEAHARESARNSARWATAPGNPCASSCRSSATCGPATRPTTSSTCSVSSTCCSRKGARCPSIPAPTTSGNADNAVWRPLVMRGRQGAA